MRKIDGEQKGVFLKSAGDEFYTRNKSWMLTSASESETDSVIRCMELVELKPKAVLEIGCANGWRLHAVNRKFGSHCYGIDPSAQAVKEGQVEYPHLELQQGTADSLPYENECFDAVIIGFCLYLCDRPDLFKIASEVDRVLANKGAIVSLDFHPSFSFRNAYHHRPGLFSYKMDYSRLFSWNPAYTIQFQWIFSHSGANEIDNVNERVSVIILRKNMEGAYVDNPFSNRLNPQPPDGNP